MKESRGGFCLNLDVVVWKVGFETLMDYYGTRILSVMFINTQKYSMWCETA